MVLDPFSAISLAGNIIKFVDFTTKLVDKGQEIYHSGDGALIENLELETIIRNLTGLLSQLSKPFRDAPTTPSSSNDAEESKDLALKTLSESCVSVAKDLIDTLEGIKINGSHRKWRSVRQALKTSRSNEKIESLVRRISRYRDELSFHLILVLRLVILGTCLLYANGVPWNIARTTISTT
jgi:hypothetical protein